MSIVAEDISVESGRRRNRGGYRVRTKGYTSSGDENLLDTDKRNGMGRGGGSEVGEEGEGWGENTTCVTGNTSEHSYGGGDGGGWRPGQGLAAPKDPVRLRCSRAVWLLAAGFTALFALLSPPVMVALPKTIGPLVAGEWNTTACDVECEGLLLESSLKLVLLVVGVWALYVRRATADLPRLYVQRALMLAAVFFSCAAFWLFYYVRIVRRLEPSFLHIAGFADNLLNVQLVIYLTAIALLWIRPTRPEFKIRVVRSPDGQSKTFSLGRLSIQEAAVEVLKCYYTDFPYYNPYLMKLPGAPTARMRSRGRGGEGGGSQAGVGLKLYSVDEAGGEAEVLPSSNAQAVMMAAARKRDSGHNERFYEELDWERRVKKRKARLLTAAEEAFHHIRRLHLEKSPTVPMEAEEAARSIFPSFSRPLSKFLRVTRQQPRHSSEQATRHLAECLSFDLGPRAFLERFFSSEETFEASELSTKWSLVTDELGSRDVAHGTTFALRCLAPGPNAGVQLLCTAARLPFLNLTEELFRPDLNKFTLRLSSETSV